MEQQTMIPIKEQERLVAELFRDNKTPKPAPKMIWAVEIGQAMYWMKNNRDGFDKKSCTDAIRKVGLVKGRVYSFEAGIYGKDMDMMIAEFGHNFYVKRKYAPVPMIGD